LYIGVFNSNFTIIRFFDTELKVGKLVELGESLQNYQPSAITNVRKLRTITRWQLWAINSRYLKCLYHFSSYIVLYKV